MKTTLTPQALAASAFALALFAVPALAANAPKTTAPADPPGPAKTGQAMFIENCSACHQPNGVGIPGAFPALVADKIVLGPAPAMATLVLNGKGGMPTFKGELSDAQLASIMTYVRSAWGNKAPAVTPAVVKAARGAAPPPKASSQALQAH